MNCNDNYEMKWNIMKYIGGTVVRGIQKKIIFQLYVLIHTLKILKEINKWFNVCMDK